jgi:AraC family transcriptional regulator, regulatory protein of adaptative response / methylated-DNA-[protein]-cysteine methyltransferase
MNSAVREHVEARKHAVAHEPAEIKYAVERCSLGVIVVAASEKGVCAILLGDDPTALVRDLNARFPGTRVVKAEGSLGGLVAKVVKFVESPNTSVDVPLDARGTQFQQRVWLALQKIPAGATATYTDIATEIGAPRSVRAVAQACGANPIAVAIPCHRVVRSDGGLSGYRWGVERKRALLAREGAR